MSAATTNHQQYDYYTSNMSTTLTTSAINDIASSMSDIAINNHIDFTEFLDVLDDVNIKYDNEEKTIHNYKCYNKTKLNQYFHELLTLLQCNSHELNISKFYQYIIKNYNEFTKYSAIHKLELTATNYMKYLIDLSLNCDSNHQNQIPVESLMSIGEQLNAYLEDSDNIDFQDFVGYCTEFVSDTYSKKSLKFLYEFICEQQSNEQTDIRTAFFLRIIAKYANNTNNTRDIIKSAFNTIISNTTNKLTNKIRSHLQDSDEKQCGKINFQQFRHSLKSAKINCISPHDMRRIFDLNATNGHMKIDTFMKRFNVIDSNKTASNCTELILNVFGNIVKRYDKSKRKSKKLERKYQQIFNIKENEYKTLIQKQQNEIQELNIKLQQQQTIRLVDAKILKKANTVSEIRLKRINDCDRIINKQRLQIKQLEITIRDTKQKMDEALNMNYMLKQRKFESELKMWKDKYMNMETQKNGFEILANNRSREIEFLKQNVEIKKKVIKWQWEENDKTWKTYPENISKQIEELEEKKSMQYILKAPTHIYEITKQSKDSAFQINIKTNMNRNIRRMEVIEDRMDYKYPKCWNMNVQYGMVQLNDLNLSDPISQKIAKRFYETVNGYKIVKIESVQNEMLYESYLNERKKLIKLNGDNALNEKQLFHGTKQDVMKCIEIQGFRKEFNHRARYGEGTYLAKDASYSVHYSKQNGNGIYKMFLCYVLCGEMYIGSQNYQLTNWPIKNNGLMYDSLVDNMYDPKIVVIHENVRAYPMFVIHFR
eukprot:263238_1